MTSGWRAARPSPSPRRRHPRHDWPGCPPPIAGWRRSRRHEIVRVGGGEGRGVGVRGDENFEEDGDMMPCWWGKV